MGLNNFPYVKLINRKERPSGRSFHVQIKEMRQPITSNLQAYRQLISHAALHITESHQSWMAFLQAAAKLYKYSHNEQAMIRAQRPGATACAEYDFWNDKMGRMGNSLLRGGLLYDCTAEEKKLSAK